MRRPRRRLLWFGWAAFWLGGFTQWIDSPGWALVYYGAFFVVAWLAADWILRES